MFQSRQSTSTSFIIFSLFLYFFCLTSISNAANATLTWDTNTESDLEGYKVYFGTSSGIYGAPITVGNSNSYTITGLSETTYYFSVTAYDTVGNESDFSNEVTKTVTISTGTGTVTGTVTDNTGTVTDNTGTVTDNTSTGTGTGTGTGTDEMNTGLDNTLITDSERFDSASSGGGGCGMIRSGGGGEPPNPGDGAAMLTIFGLMMLILLKKSFKTATNGVVADQRQRNSFIF